MLLLTPGIGICSEASEGWSWEVARRDWPWITRGRGEWARIGDWGRSSDWALITMRAGEMGRMPIGVGP